MRQRNHWRKVVAAGQDHGQRDEILGAMLRRRRRNFLPSAVQHLAGYNRPLQIGWGQTNSQPSTVADMLGLLDVRSGQRVLDVGAGSGWTTAILGDLVGSTGTVLGVERLPELVQRAQVALDAEQDQLPWVSVRLADPEVLGAPQKAPFDRILVSAQPEYLPTDLVEQLTPQGVMVITVAGQMLRIQRTGAGVHQYQVTKHGTYSFVELVLPSPGASSEDRYI